MLCRGYVLAYLWLVQIEHIDFILTTRQFSQIASCLAIFFLGVLVFIIGVPPILAVSTANLCQALLKLVG